MAVGQTRSYNGQKPLAEISRTDFQPVETSKPLRVLPENIEGSADASQGIVTCIKVFVQKPAETELLLGFIRKLLKIPSVAKLSLALPTLDIPFLKAVAELVPESVEFGVCDYDAAALQTLLDAGVRISCCLINADACCALPKDILALSRDTGIKLIAHHDPVALNTEFGTAISRAVSVYEKRQVIAYSSYHCLY